MSATGGGCLLPGGVSATGGVGIPACTETDPPVNRMTDRCKNITLPQTSFAGGKYWMTCCSAIRDHSQLDVIGIKGFFK